MAVQISKELFRDLCEYFLNDNKSVEEDITEQLSKKLDKLVAHILFTRYKKADLNTEEREYYRKQYLEHINVSRDFQTEKETRKQDL